MANHSPRYARCRAIDSGPRVLGPGRGPVAGQCGVYSSEGRPAFSPIRNSPTFAIRQNCPASQRATELLLAAIECRHADHNLRRNYDADGMTPRECLVNGLRLLKAGRGLLRPQTGLKRGYGLNEERDPDARKRGQKTDRFGRLAGIASVGCGETLSRNSAFTLIITHHQIGERTARRREVIAPRVAGHDYSVR